MSKVKDHSELMGEVEQRLFELKKIIENMEEHRGRSFVRWLANQNKYLEWEVEFNPKRLKNYKRGEIVHINFGFNVGSEHGGPHWGAILDDNKWSSPTALVIPLGSLDGELSEQDVHRDDVYLGQIPSINHKLVFGIPTQIRAISKLRITKPRKSADMDYHLTNEQLDRIDRKVYSLLFSKSKAIHEVITTYKEIAATNQGEVDKIE